MPTSNRTLYVLVSTTTGARGVTSYEPRLLRARITSSDTQAVVPWSESGSLARIRRAVARHEAWLREQAAITAMLEERDDDSDAADPRPVYRQNMTVVVQDDLCPVAVSL